MLLQIEGTTTLFAFMDKLKGKFNKEITISIEDGDKKMYVDLNKNEARYLMNYLAAFVNEDKI